MFLAQFEIKKNRSLKPYFKASDNKVEKIDFRACENNAIKFTINKDFNLEVSK